ncbi:MAG: chaperonin GroEL, partial [Verrucomicrobiae bacterium]|nr:chaperonin GroEL [Verrucomicrobiae bacterium]
IVPGGGVALLRTLPALENLKLKGDEAIGVQIVMRAIEEPLRQLADNAGEEGSLIVQEVKSRKGWEGFDCEKLEYTDMGKAGIIDPTKVTRCALQNAASIAGLLLTTECAVTEIPEKEKNKGGHSHGGGDMDY